MVRKADFTLNMTYDDNATKIMVLDDEIQKHDDDLLNLAAVVADLTDRIETLEVQRLELSVEFDALKRENIRLFQRIRNLERVPQ